MISTSVFEDSSGEEESNWKAGQFVAQRLTPFMPNAPEITAGRVVAQTVK
jgi:hypothetical protein